MNTNIYYFSGTGNSLSIAKKIKNKTENSQLISIPSAMEEKSNFEEEIIGIVSPIYMYNIPYMVVDFIKKIKKAKYVFFIFSGAGQAGNGIKVVKNLFSSQNIKLNALFNIAMPNNYTPYGYVKENTQKKLFKKADKRIEEIIDIVVNKKEFFDKNKTGFFKSNIFPGILYKLAYNRVNILDKNFFVDSNCNGCSTCEKVCPVSNITMQDNKPKWNNNCEQCYACIQWCSKCSIQINKKTIGVKRYHHPEITLKEIIKSSKNNH